MDKEQKQMLVDALKRYHDCAFTPGVYEHSIVGQAALILEKSEEVVRCKDCIHSFWDEENEMWKCVESAEYDSNYGDYIGWVHYHKADYYCADGERKDND